MQKIAIIEDDDNIREMVAYALAAAGFGVQEFAEGAAFFDVLPRCNPDLLLLDIMLPGEDGITILKKLRQIEESIKLPVIMLTAKGAEIDRIKGLDLGADDYMIKPFSVMELISRIRAVMRRCDGIQKEEVFTVGEIVLDARKRCVLAGGERLLLTFKEFELLNYLMANVGIVLSRDKLLEKVWGFDYNGESRTVDMHIKSLRQKLGVYGSAIATVRNIGYKIGI